MRAMRPEFSRPALFHDLPASVDLYIPMPAEMCERMKGSPEPAHTTFGSPAATEIEPNDDTGRVSAIADQCMPPSVVFQMPPDAAPA